MRCHRGQFSRPRGRGKSARPSSPHARRILTSAKFVRLLLNQLSIPEPPRGLPADDRHLTHREKLFLATLTHLCNEQGYREAKSWSYVVPWRLDPVKIAEAMGWQGNERARRGRITNIIHGRPIRGIEHPGLLDRGWILYLPGRLIIPSDRWLEASPIRLHVLGRGDSELIQTPSDFDSACQIDGNDRPENDGARCHFVTARTVISDGAAVIFPPPLNTRQETLRRRRNVNVQRGDRIGEPGTLGRGERTPPVFPVRNPCPNRTPLRSPRARSPPSPLPPSPRRSPRAPGSS